MVGSVTDSTVHGSSTTTVSRKVDLSDGLDVLSAEFITSLA